MVSTKALCAAALVATAAAFAPAHAARRQPRRVARAAGSGVESADGLSGMRPLVADDYVCYGLAMCFKKVEGAKKPVEQWVWEPLTAGTLETVAAGVPTSYRRLLALKASDVLTDPFDEEASVIVAALAPLCPDGEEAILCEDAVERTLAAARTIRRRVEATAFMEFGETLEETNFSVELKRILNENYEPSDSDNIKQDASIDVYGRDADVSAEDIEKLANA